MKKSIRILAVAMVAIMLCLCLASCGNKLSGTYKNALLGEFEFKGSKVTYSIAGQELEGTYKIEDDKISFDFTGDDEDEVEELLDELTDGASFEKGDDYIKINGVKYEKVD